jgi:hypothetical protein
MKGHELDIATNCYMVERDVKPASCIPIQLKHYDDTKELMKNYDVNYYIEELSEEWFTLWIYKYNHILDIIIHSPNEPKTIYDHWILGKLFGYSDSSIEKFINQTKENDNA